jgi:hypothetical protein
MHSRIARASLLTMLFGVLIPDADANATARFGTYCAEDFENSWRDSLPYSWDRCAGFNNELDDTDTKAFYYNLVGKEYYLEQYGDHQPNNDSADDVDLLFINTHGGAWTSPMTSTLVMWNQNQRAYSTDMRLGDSAWWGGGLAVLATYACETLKMSDGNLVNRLAPMLRGGLKIALGSHDTLNSGVTTDECGEDFADNLQGSSSFKSAWKSALEDWATDQDIAIVSTGANSSDCVSRKDNMKWQNYGGYDFIRDDNIGYTCWTWWDNE